tara:strand:- start:2551 stop:3081 length:531 start_codon:yes stop_codon:yes gene_type:complete
MGLDMYFEGSFAKRSFIERKFDERRKCEIDPDFETTLKSIGFENAPIEITNWNYYSINIPIAYWRKVSSIHQWFVENVQHNNDDCGRYYVDENDISNLVEEIDNILSEPDPNRKIAKAEANLPNTTGCFFGSQEYDKYYFEDLEYTKKRMQACLDWQKKMAGTGKCFDNFYYQSSW